MFQSFCLIVLSEEGNGDGNYNITCGSLNACSRDGASEACCDCGRVCTPPSEEMKTILTHFNIDDANLCYVNGDQ